MRALDVTAIGRGVAFALIVAVPALLAGLTSSDEPPFWLEATYLMAMAAAFAIAGFVAGLRRTDTPMLHGGAAAAALFIVVEAITLPQVVARGGDVAWDAVGLVGLVATTVGVASGLSADWHHRRRIRAVDPQPLAPPGRGQAPYTDQPG